MPIRNTQTTATGFRRYSRAFLRGTAGNVAIIFALSVVPIVVAVGAAVEYSSAAHKRNQLQVATDSAALAGAGFEPASEEVCRDRARKVFDGKLAELTLHAKSEPQIVCHASGVSVTAEASVATSLMSMAGIRTLGLESSSEVTCGMVSEAGSSRPIAWRQAHLPDMTRVVTLGTTIFGTVLYWRTPEGNPIVRIDNPSNEPTTIVLRSTPASPDGNFSFQLPDRGQFFVVIPWNPPPGNVVFSIQEGPEPRSGGTATWSNSNNRTISTIPGTPVYATEEARRCWISS